MRSKLFLSLSFFNLSFSLFLPFLCSCSFLVFPLFVFYSIENSIQYFLQLALIGLKTKRNADKADMRSAHLSLKWNAEKKRKQEEERDGEKESGKGIRRARKRDEAIRCECV